MKTSIAAKTLQVSAAALPLLDIKQFYFTPPGRNTEP